MLESENKPKVNSKISNNVGFKLYSFNTCQKVFNQFIIHIVFLIV